MADTNQPSSFQWMRDVGISANEVAWLERHASAGTKLDANTRLIASKIGDQAFEGLCATIIAPASKLQ